MSNIFGGPISSAACCARLSATTNATCSSTYPWTTRAWSCRTRSIRPRSSSPTNPSAITISRISAIRQVLAQHRVKDNVDILPVSHDADINPKHQPSYQVQQMIDGQYDVVGVWGPFAGYYKAVKKAPITLQPVNMMEDNFPLEYELGLGVQPQERILKYKIDLALNDTRAEIQKVLNDYGVPLVKCSE